MYGKAEQQAFQKAKALRISHTNEHYASLWSWLAYTDQSVFMTKLWLIEGQWTFQNNNKLTLIFSKESNKNF